VKNVYDIFLERGFVEQVTDDEAIGRLLDEQGVTCYIGFDPTATSLHIGSLVPIMALAHMQRHGHRPIALVGGGTGLIGDPSGKTEMRQILTRDKIDYNARCLQQQLARYLDFSAGRAMLLNNADWLTRRVIRCASRKVLISLNSTICFYKPMIFFTYSKTMTV